MTTNFPPGWSAEIYEFPTRARSNIGGQYQDNNTASEFESTPLPEVTFGTGWYHDAAIEESRRPYKRTQH
jgi:Protein of unknown function (DUF2735)